MSDMIKKKNGLLYSADGKTVIGVDDTTQEFTGRIPYGAYSIDDDVFAECPYESFSIPDSVKILGKRLFKKSQKLEKVKLPAFVTELPVELFSGCESLKKVIMPNELKGFPDGLFYKCSSLCEIPFRNGIKVLPNYVFAGCKSLKSLVIPDSVQVINEMAVADCIGLESVVFPAGIIEIAYNAFEGCTSLHNIRLSGENQIFYIGEDGSLYMRTGSSNGDQLVVKAYKVEPVKVGYFEENIDDEPIDIDEDEIDDDNEPVFTTEIGDEEIENKTEGDVMSDVNDVDSMLADIMGEERERISTSEDVGVSDKESEALSEAISVMEDSSISKGATVSEDELEKLFSKNEQEVIENQSVKSEKDENELDSKSKILVDAVKINKILNFNSLNAEGELFVIAEKTVTTEDGSQCFSAHLESCCTKLAKIHDFKKVILIYGLSVDNDEFMEFYRHFMSKKNVVLACEAERPSQLSDYCKIICESSRISLEKNDLAEQRRFASVKTNNLIKLVVKDIYE